MKKPRICFGHFFLEFLGPNEASKAQNPFFCHIFLAIVIAWQFKCGDFDKLKNATNLLHFNLDFVTFWLKFFFRTKDRWCKVPSTYYYKGGGGILLLFSFYCVWHHKIRGYFGEIKLVEGKIWNTKVFWRCRTIFLRNMYKRWCSN